MALTIQHSVYGSESIIIHCYVFCLVRVLSWSTFASIRPSFQDNKMMIERRFYVKNVRNRFAVQRRLHCDDDSIKYCNGISMRSFITFNQLNSFWSFVFRRLLAIWWPLKLQISKKRAKVMILGIWVIAGSITVCFPHANTIPSLTFWIFHSCRGQYISNSCRFSTSRCAWSSGRADRRKSITSSSEIYSLVMYFRW